ncbi:hypothetical protein C8D88_102394 [Lentzea atacamensis]|uniref:Uncharacterized protein n=1 Tax=Lentzea atacamensis TaxID=531938 RepID=A0A316I929_9PSEU|nr:hypothetical protein [Lentzea atacamensis]PWK89123.1 hypothetical protein C8D88_102394 [Lentzea atacamensis]
MPQDPYEELGAALGRASSRALVFSALGCIHRASAVLIAGGVVDGDVAPFSEGSLLEMGQLPDLEAIQAVVVSRQQGLAVLSADPETGELPEESDRAELLAMAAEMVLRASVNTNPASLREWADFCSSLSDDIAQHLDGMQLSSVDEYNSRLPSPYEEIPPLPAREIFAQLEIIRIVDDADADAVSRISELSTELRRELLVIASEAAAPGGSSD